MKIYRAIYSIGLHRSKKELVKRFGKEYTIAFCSKSKLYLKKVIKKTPDIGDTVFAFNYAFTPAYIAWYRAARDLQSSEKDIQDILWLINERIITLVPKSLRAAYGRSYLKHFKKKAPQHELLMDRGKIHPYDYLIKFRPGDDNSFGIDIIRCGMMTLANDFDAMGIFPAVCRVDYIMANFMHMGFERTMTLGDGDCCCNCRYIIDGSCEWSLESNNQDRR